MTTRPITRHAPSNVIMVKPPNRPRLLARFLIVLHLWQISVPGSLAYAQDLAVVPDRTAPSGQRPIMDAAPNGVPLVHIAPPSPGGVSRNQYEHFSVNPNGVILNNATTETQTELGGWVSSNVQLGPRPARVILNEVTSTNPSQLRGVIEVAGHRADIVIANPNGITCDGCGFINSPRATLSTGTPQFDGNGALTGLDVRRGEIGIGTGGLTATNVEQLDLIARGLVIEGEVWAQNLNALAGANQVLYGTLTATSQSGTGMPPRFAIDIKDLGGMYANQIFMIATEKGLGVNSTGRVAALQGNLHLSANGDLTVRDSYAKQDLTVTSAGATTLTGQTLSEGNTTLNTAGGLDNTGEVEAQGSLTITADSVTNTGRFVQRGVGVFTLSATGEVQNSGGVFSAGTLDVKADTLTDTHGQWQSTGDVTVQAQQMALTESNMSSDGSIQLTTTGRDLLVNTSSLSAASTLTLNAANELHVQNSPRLSGQAIDLSGATVSTVGSTVDTATDLRIRTPGALDTGSSDLRALGAITLDAASLTNRNGAITSNTSTAITTTGLIDNTGGIIAGTGALTLTTQAGSLVNETGRLVSDGVLNLTAGAFNNRTGTLEGAGGITANLNGPLDNTNGTVLAVAGAVSLQTSSAPLTNVGGAIFAAQSLNIATASLDNTTGELSGANVDLRSDSLNNTQGTLAADGSLTLNTGTLDNTAGLLGTAGTLLVRAPTLINTDGTLTGERGLSLFTAAPTLTGQVTSAQDVTLNVDGDYLNSATLSAQQNLTVNAQTLTNTGTLTAGNTLTATSTGDLFNHGEISATTTQVSAGSTLTNTGVIDGLDTTVRAFTLDNTGLILGDTLRLGADTIHNHGTGTLAARQTLLIGARVVNNCALNPDGRACREPIVSNEPLRGTTTGEVITDGAQILSLGDITIRGTLDANGVLTGTAQSVTNIANRIDAQANLTVAADKLRNLNGGIQTQQRILGVENFHQIEPAGQFLVAGKLEAGRYPITRFVSGSTGGAPILRFIVDPVHFGQRSTLLPVRSELCDNNTGLCTTQINYTWDSPVFVQLNVTPPPPPPPEPTAADRCGRFNPPQICTDFTAWSALFTTALEQLDPAIAAENIVIAAENELLDVEDYKEYFFDRTSTTTEVTVTAPALMVAGQHTTLTGQVENRDSRLITQGNLDITAPNVDNPTTQGIASIDDLGAVQDIEVIVERGKNRRRSGGFVTFDPPAIDSKIALGTTTTTFNNPDLNPVTTSPSPAPAVRALPLPGTSGAPEVVLTATVSPRVPDSSLFRIDAAPNAAYLVETDPRFTRFDTFISSEYFFNALARDPVRNLKRYGDAYFEQRLIDDQVMALTGRRFLGDYTATETEYTALMDAGAAFANTYQLTPGVALTADQMASLTTDIVWLETQTVTLADNTTQDVLVPKVYLRRPQAADLSATGALMSAGSIQLRTDHALRNSGTIQGDQFVAIGAENVENTGTVASNQVRIRALNDITNRSGVIAGTGENSRVTLLVGRDIVLETTVQNSINESGTAQRSSLNRVATVQADDITLHAERDVTAIGADVLSTDSLLVSAARDLVIRPTESHYTLTEPNQRESERINHASQLRSGGDLTLVARGNLDVVGAHLESGGTATVQGTNVNITAAIDQRHVDRTTTSGPNTSRVERLDETLSGGTVSAGQDLVVIATGQIDPNDVLKIGGAVQVDVTDGQLNVQRNALPPVSSPPTEATAASEPKVPVTPEAPKFFGADGTGNVTLSGAYLNAGGRVVIQANHDVTVQNLVTEHLAVDEGHSEKDGLFGSRSSTSSSRSSRQQIESSTISAGRVSIDAGHDATIQASQIVADQTVRITADNDLTITSAAETSQQQSDLEQRRSGLLSNGGFSVTLGKQHNEQDQTGQSVTHIGSTVGSLAGNIVLEAGRHYTQTASAITATQGSLAITAQAVDILAQTDDNTEAQRRATKQSGLTVAISNPIVNAAQTTTQMANAAGRTDDRRLQGLALATAALSVSNVVDAVKGDLAHAGGVNVSATVGTNASRSESNQQRATAVGSTLTAGGDVIIQAKGQGRDSNITAVGATIRSSGDTVLQAEGNIALLAAENTAQSQSQNANRSTAAGVGVAVGVEGAGPYATASASRGTGNSNSEDRTWTETQVNAGGTLSLQSGGDTTLRGATARGERVVTHIGGDLKIESLQDTHTTESDQKNAGASVTVYSSGNVSGSANLGKTNIDSTYTSVNEQSGLYAGDSGYDLDVKGGTTLTGGVITSTDQAERTGKNRLETAYLITRDIENHAEYSANSISLGVGYGGQVGKDQPGQAQTGANNTPGTDTPKQGNLSATPPMALHAEGERHSTTRSAINTANVTITDAHAQQTHTGETVDQRLASLNRDTAHAAGTLEQIFDQEKIQTGFEITGALTREVGTFVENRAKEADTAKQKLNAELAKGKQADPQQVTQLADDYNEAKQWGPGGTYRQITTAITAAAGGNVTGTTAQFIQATAVNYLQSLGAREVKALADGLDENQNAARTALHALVACAGASAQNGNCGSAAVGAASGTVINALLGNTKHLTAEQREARRNLVTTLVAATTAASGADAAAATNAAQIETENNQLAPTIPIRGGAVGTANGPIDTTAPFLNESDIAYLKNALSLGILKQNLAVVAEHLGLTENQTAQAANQLAREQAREDLDTALRSYNYIVKNSDPIYIPSALNRVNKIAEEHGFKLEEFDGGIRITGSTPGFPADSGVSIPTTVETPINQPGKNDGRYATPGIEPGLKDAVGPGFADGSGPNLPTTTASPMKQGGWQSGNYLSDNPNGTDGTTVDESVADNLSLLDGNATTHILDGDNLTSGGHRYGTGSPGKSEFPQNWSDNKITNIVSDIATDPSLKWSKPDARGYITTTATRDGVDVKVVYDTKNNRIVTGYPTNLGKNPKK